jgi:hypothetical protein
MKNKLFYIVSSVIIGIIIGVVASRYYELHKLKELHAVNSPHYSIDGLKESVMVKGDIGSYLKLQSIYRESSSADFLFWAMLMANKSDYPKAYEDVYYCIEENYPPDSTLFKMDDKTRAFALYYLKQAAMKNDTSASDKLNALKKMNIPQSWLK